MMRTKKSKGFTLIELVIVIIIVGILAAVSVPMYKGYTRKAMASEGRALVGAVSNALKVYYAEHNEVTSLADSFTSGSDDLPVNAMTNKYFSGYTVASTAADQYTITTSGDEGSAAEGITITMTAADMQSPPTITEAGTNQ